MTQGRRLFSADSHCVITSDAVKNNLASKYHGAWDEGMAKHEAQQAIAQNGETLELEGIYLSYNTYV